MRAMWPFEIILFELLLLFLDQIYPHPKSVHTRIFSTGVKNNNKSVAKNWKVRQKQQIFEFMQ